MDILISGAGIAGPCLAWWLARDGHRPVLVERAAGPRSAGYIIDFWGEGYGIAERMGLLPRLHEVGYRVKEVRLVNAAGRLHGGFGGDVFGRTTQDRFISLARGQLSLALIDAVRDRTELRFGDTITGISPEGAQVAVNFAHAPAQRFDLVIGAEGIHSVTRDLVFGPKAQFERFLGFCFAAWLVDDYPRRDPDVYVMYGEPGRQAARFSLRGGSTLVLLIWRDNQGTLPPDSDAAARALIRRNFADAHWELPGLLASLENARDLYVDRVSQIRMDRWCRGRVALLGDAAFAPSFLAGQGSALAMIGGYVLAGELKRAGGDVELALSAYERRLQPFLRAKQDAALKMAASFVPKTRLGLLARRLATSLLKFDWIADRLIGSSLRDPIALPEYWA